MRRLFRRNERGSAGMAEVVVMMVLVAAIVFCAGGWSAIECSSKTSDIGYAHRWGPIGGCQIEVEQGRWIPLDQWYYKNGPGG